MSGSERRIWADEEIAAELSRPLVSLGVPISSGEEGDFSEDDASSSSRFASSFADSPQPGTSGLVLPRSAGMSSRPASRQRGMFAVPDSDTTSSSEDIEPVPVGEKRKFSSVNEKAQK